MKKENQKGCENIGVDEFGNMEFICGQLRDDGEIILCPECSKSQSPKEIAITPTNNGESVSKSTKEIGSDKSLSPLANHNPQTKPRDRNLDGSASKDEVANRLQEDKTADTPLSEKERIIDSLLHIYGQEEWHDDINIYGNRKALESLKNALIVLLETEKWNIKMPNDIFIKSFVNDGEEFTLFLHLKEDKEMDKLPVPYTSEIAKNKMEVRNDN